MAGALALYGVFMIMSGILGAILASTKNRDASAWTAWCFLLPPMLALLVAMPKYKGRRRRRMTLDEEDALLLD
ncbi:MAG: hypothetical protein AAGG99_06065 [Pseudomonadota bacterium]